MRAACLLLAAAAGAAHGACRGDAQWHLFTAAGTVNSRGDVFELMHELPGMLPVDMPPVACMADAWGGWACDDFPDWVKTRHYAVKLLRREQEPEHWLREFLRKVPRPVEHYHHHTLILGGVPPEHDPNPKEEVTPTTQEEEPPPPDMFGCFILLSAIVALALRVAKLEDELKEMRKNVVKTE